MPYKAWCSCCLSHLAASQCLPRVISFILSSKEFAIPTAAVPNQLKLLCQLKASCTRAICFFVSNANPTKPTIPSQLQKNQGKLSAEEGLNSCTQDQPATRNGLRQKQSSCAVSGELLDSPAKEYIQVFSNWCYSHCCTTHPGQLVRLPPPAAFCVCLSTQQRQQLGLSSPTSCSNCIPWTIHQSTNLTPPG